MNKIATLAKIANRLDSLGLTREADILDTYIRKVAEDLTPPNPEGTAAPVASTDPATTTWEDGEYTYSYNLGTDQMFIVSGPGTTAPKQVTKTSNSTAYYAIRNQYEHKMGLPKTKPVLPLTDETEIFNMIKDIMSRYNLQIRHCYNNRLKQKPELAGKWNISFTINKNGTVKNANAKPAPGTESDKELEFNLAKTVGLWTFAQLAEEQGVTKTITFGAGS